MSEVPLYAAGPWRESARDREGKTERKSACEKQRERVRGGESATERDRGRDRKIE
jgi:hypothetical protein